MVETDEKKSSTKLNCRVKQAQIECRGQNWLWLWMGWKMSQNTHKEALDHPFEQLAAGFGVGVVRVGPRVTLEHQEQMEGHRDAQDHLLNTAIHICPV